MIKGHFWVELDGKIIDPWFEVYDGIIRLKGLTNEKVYRPASKTLQGRMIKTHILAKLQTMIKLNMNKKELAKVSPAAFCCDTNAIINKIKHLGSRIVYGDFGWKRKDGGGVYFEFEHDWNGKLDGPELEYVMKTLGLT